MKNYITGDGRCFQWPLMLSIVAAILIQLSSCQKYLDAKPDQTLSTPSTISDLEGILNNYNFLNARFPAAEEVAADNFYLNTADLNSLTVQRQRMFYTWQKDDDIGADYTGPYGAVEYANIIIDELPNVTGGDVNSRNVLKGNALFLRGALHFALSQLFAKPYIKATASSDLGIALRLTSDITVKPVRATIAETYSSVLNDLKQSVSLLPDNPTLKYQASKPAAYGMLAKAYLSMSDYINAGLYADSALSFYNKLIDYNTVSATAAIPFAEFNNEVVYDARGTQPQALTLSKARVDTNLYASYAVNDLRKVLYFKTSATGTFFKPGYCGVNNGAIFTGVATDELYFIKAETQDRQGNISGALSTLNTLLLNRYKKGTFSPYTITDGNQLLMLILQERRKELLLRGTRWTDLRRLNQDPQFAITLYRNVNSTTYQLLPGGARYVFEIDQNAVNLSGLIQNP